MKMKSLIFLLPILLLVPACFSTGELVSPETTSLLTLNFSRTGFPDSPGQLTENSAQLSQLLAAVDSVVVKVFYAGSGGKLEAARGVPLPLGSDTVTVSLAVSPEKHKRVAVELYEAGRLIYFGVNEDVDVFLGKQTTVTIDAFAFSLDGVEVTGSYLTAGEGFTVHWRRVPSATAYYIQESPAPDFTNISYEVVLTDTAVTFMRSEGPYFYRVAPLNDYTFGSFCPPELVYVYGAPAVNAITPAAAARGETITIRGRGLDYPGNELYIGGELCQVTSAGPMEVRAIVPQDAVTDTVYVTGSLGTGRTTGPYRIQLVAYVSGADLTTAQQDQLLIQMDGPHSFYIQNTGVKIVALPDLDTADMSVYVAIIIGPNTGDNADWGDGVEARVAAIQNSQAQVIGLGAGGYAYYREAGLYIGQQSTGQDTGHSAFVVDLADPIYTWPVQLDQGRDLQMYKVDVPRLSVQVVGMQPVDIFLHASLENGSDMFLLLNEIDDGTGLMLSNFFWGFEAGPAAMTFEGQTCFLNILANLFKVSSKVDISFSLAL